MMRRSITMLGLLAILGSACSVEQSAACDEVLTPQRQEGSHLIGDTEPPVPYTSNPPTSGWHRSGAPSLGVVDEPLSGPALVQALEAGHVVVAYDPDALDPGAVQRLREMAQGQFADRVTVTPWAPMATSLALVGFGVLQRCSELDETVVSDFVLTHSQVAPSHG